MTSSFLAHLANEITEIKKAGLYKAERVLASPQDAVITLDDGSEVINFCANNYLGLANNGVLEDAAASAVKEQGYGMASVRFICGTQSVHKKLEHDISIFLRTEDTILYSSQRRTLRDDPRSRRCHRL
jgi:glycine C-acetyltransferase